MPLPMCFFAKLSPNALPQTILPHASASSQMPCPKCPLPDDSFYVSGPIFLNKDSLQTPSQSRQRTHDAPKERNWGNMGIINDKAKVNKNTLFDEIQNSAPARDDKTKHVVMNFLGRLHSTTPQTPTNILQRDINATRPKSKRNEGNSFPGGRSTRPTRK